MKRFRYFGLLPLIAVLVWGRAVAQDKPSASPNRSDALVGRLYEQVVARHPLGVPDARIFAPYLSKALLHRFDLANACLRDWLQQNPDPNLKPPSGLIEDGLFSGSSERADPTAFHVEIPEFVKYGSSRVYVRLTWEDPANKPFNWYVAAVVVSENGRPVVDDVLYLKDKKGDVESSLSRDLSAMCNGAHWIGDYPHPR